MLASIAEISVAALLEPHVVVDTSGLAENSSWHALIKDRKLSAE